MLVLLFMSILLSRNFQKPPIVLRARYEPALTLLLVFMFQSPLLVFRNHPSSLEHDMNQP